MPFIVENAYVYFIIVSNVIVDIYIYIYICIY